MRKSISAFSVRFLLFLVFLLLVKHHRYLSD